MTGLIAGSMSLIVVSALALVFGWTNASALLIWISIASSAAAAVCLALAYSASRNLSGSADGGRRKA